MRIVEKKKKKIYIYIYRERERERGTQISGFTGCVIIRNGIIIPSPH